MGAFVVSSKGELYQIGKNECNMCETRNTVHMCDLTKKIKTQKLNQKIFASKI